jgi:hypothetical protein
MAPAFDSLDRLKLNNDTHRGVFALPAGRPRAVAATQ